MVVNYHREALAGVPYDLVVVGGGLAGLVAALTAAGERRVALVAGRPAPGSSSWHAQGGIAAAVSADDSPALHGLDTLAAGRGLCRPSAVRTLTEEGPARLAELAELGVAFDAGLGLEGGHSRRRIHHAGGASTGRIVSRTLARRVLEHPAIDVLSGLRVTGLLALGDRCAGVVTEGGALPARATILATGGMAALWARTTNPVGSVGEGIALAYSAGAAVADLELVQFHPTVLADNGLLLSEALRGEGALLVDEEGRRFTDELAPRDVVARAVGERETALLDLRPVDRGRFPSLMSSLQDAGYDPALEPIPVAPAAHYTMGGIVTDLDGRSELPGLYAAGECACTGVHGANRLASNSLLECVVFGRRAALASASEPPLPAGRPCVAAVVPPPAGDDVRRALWEHAGLVRDAAGLERLLGAPHPLARLVAEGALLRAESRGGHFRVDHPSEEPSLAVHVVHRRGRPPALEAWR
jgi:L-aspartate oxidase